MTALHPILYGSEQVPGVKIVGYIPHDTFLVLSSAVAQRALRTIPAVLWVGRLPERRLFALLISCKVFWAIVNGFARGKDRIVLAVIARWGPSNRALRQKHVLLPEVAALCDQRKQKSVPGPVRMLIHAHSLGDDTSTLEQLTQQQARLLGRSSNQCKVADDAWDTNANQCPLDQMAYHCHAKHGFFFMIKTCFLFHDKNMFSFR